MYSHGFQMNWNENDVTSLIWWKLLLIPRCTVWVFRDLADLLAEWNFSNRCVRRGFVYSASDNLLQLLWALVSPSLLGRQSHPAEEQRDGAERSDVFCVVIPHCTFPYEKEAWGTTQEMPIRYIQEYLALQRVLALQAFLDHPGAKDQRGILKMTCIVITLGQRSKTKQNKNSPLLLWSPWCRPFLEGPATETPI